MKIYRIENDDTQHGMWYRADGTFDPFIFRLTEGKSANLPMEFDPRYGKDGLRWISAGASVQQMQHWFSTRDAVELFQAGYRLFEFDAMQVIVEKYQVLFTREGVKARKEIPLNRVWNVPLDYREKVIL